MYHTPLYIEKSSKFKQSKLTPKFHEISREKAKTLQKLRQQSALINLSHDAIIVLDLNNIITFWNKGAKELYGWDKTEALGKMITQLLHTKFPNTLEAVRNELLKKGRWDGQLIHYTKENKRIITESRCALLKDGDGGPEAILEINRDITISKDLEKRKDEFISMASHELKTPLTTIKGYTQILQQLFKNKKTQSQYLEKIIDQVEKLTHLINDLLDVSKIQSQKLILKKENLSLDKIVREIVSDMQSIQSQHQIKVSGKINKLIKMDKFRISQVITNLISNAIKYSPKSKRVNVFLSAEDNRAIVKVQDFGIGIAKKDYEKIFEPFFQANTQIRQSFSGLGLGLHISKEIVLSHGGRIWLDSKKGIGSTFGFSLPSKNNSI